MTPYAFGARDDRLPAAAAAGWCAVVATIDWAVGGSAVLVGFLALGPLLVAAIGRPRTTLLVTAWATALALALGPVDGTFGSADHLLRVAVVASVGALAVWIAVTRQGLERARFRYRLMAEAGTVLNSALDHEVMLIELARLCSRRLADWCFVFLLEDDGSIRQVAAAHVEPERQRLAWELLMRYPLDPQRDQGPAKAIRTAEPELLPVVTDAVLRAMAADEENLRLLKALGLRSAMITPLVARGRTLGAMAFASAESGCELGPDDLALAEELSGRAAIAVETARLYVRANDTEHEVRRSHVQLQAILDGVADAVTVQDLSGRLVYANDAAGRQLGLASAGELLAADPRELIGRYEMTDADGQPFSLDDLPGRRALRGEDPEPALVLYREKATGEERWSQIKATTIRDEDGRPLLAVNVVEDVTDQREREDRQRLLGDASGALASSLDVGEMLPRVAQLLAGRIADWCAIELFDEGGEARTVAFAQADPERSPLAGGVVRSAGASEALGERRAQLTATTISVPMTVRGRLLGAISLVRDESGRAFDGDDLSLMEELAGRCAVAIDSARMYEERSQIARTLQESLLPPLLPEMPGLDVATRFRASGSGIEVGGDFYDLFDLGEAGWGIAIGDVCGKGSSAAAITALARYTVRAAAMRQHDPSQILSVLNEALLSQQADRRFCTVLYGRLSQNGAGVSFQFASGGHPLPLLLRAGNGAGELGAPGTLLGIVPDPALRDDRVQLQPGDALVLYTDGVTDAGAPDRVWTPPELAAAAGSTAGLDADSIAERMLRAALDAAAGEPRDDIAIVVLKLPE